MNENCVIISPDEYACGGVVNSTNFYDHKVTIDDVMTWSEVFNLWKKSFDKWVENLVPARKIIPTDDSKFIIAVSSNPEDTKC